MNPEIENASFEFDKKSLQPTFYLHIGIPGASYAVEIARRLGLPNDIADRAAELLGKGERSLTSLIESLEKNTLRKVRFKNLDFSSEDGKWIIRMEGAADSYAAIALQADVFGKNNNMSELMFSNLGVSFDGSVVFDVSAKIDPRLISYRNSLNSVE